MANLPAPDFRALCKELVLLWDAANDSEEFGCTAIPLAKRIRAALATPPGPPKNCWLDDELDLCPSHCVFDDPSEVISDCTYAQTIKCKTDCQYYRVATPLPEPVAYIHKQGNHWEVSKRVLLDDEKKRGWTEEPLYASRLPAPPPEPKPPTDEELEKLADHYMVMDGATGSMSLEHLHFARAALKRWGNQVTIKQTHNN